MSAKPKIYIQDLNINMNNVEIKEAQRRRGKASRRRGHSYETKIVKE